MYYFVPRVGGAQTLVTAAGLGYAFDRLPQVFEAARDEAPDELTGVILTQCDVNQVPRLHWTRLYEADTDRRVWLAYPAADRPGPEFLARADVLTAGWAAVRLADGRDWRVPLVCPCTERDRGRADQLPGTAGVTPDGRVAFIPRGDHDTLRFAVSRVMERNFDDGELIALAARLLGVGYRVQLAEVLALGLLSPKSAWEVLITAVDFNERVLVRGLHDAPDAAAGVQRVAADLALDEPTAGRVLAGVATAGLGV